MPIQKMAETYTFNLRDLEEKVKLLRDRVLLLGQTIIEQRESTFLQLQEFKKTLEILKQENLRMKEFLQRISEQLSNTARKEEVMILQRQLDLFRENGNN